MPWPSDSSAGSGGVSAPLLGSCINKRRLKMSSACTSSILCSFDVILGNSFMAGIGLLSIIQTLLRLFAGMVDSILFFPGLLGLIRDSCLIQGWNLIAGLPLRPCHVGIRLLCIRVTMIRIPSTMIAWRVWTPVGSHSRFAKSARSTDEAGHSSFKTS